MKIYLWILYIFLIPLALATSSNASADTTLQGVIWQDDGNGLQSTGESVLPGVTIYLDENNNSQLDAGELTQVTDVNGGYQFTALAVGSYVIRQVIPDGMTQTFPTEGAHKVSLSTGQTLFRGFGNLQSGYLMDTYFSNSNMGGGYGGVWLKGDLNGDGRDEVVQMWERSTDQRLGIAVYGPEVPGKKEMKTLFNEIMPGGFPHYDFKIGDFNGDGRDELVQFYKGGGVNGNLGMVVFSWVSGTGWGTVQQRSATVISGGLDNTILMVGDINGDDRDEIIQAWANAGNLLGTSVYGLVGSSLVMQALTPGGVISPNAGFGRPYSMLDTNGDGRDEMVQAWGAQNLALSVFGSPAPGAGHAMTNYGFTTIGGGLNVDDQWLVGDFNGNDREELVQVYNKAGDSFGMVVYGGIPTAMNKISDTILSGGFNGRFLVGDINGPDSDGKVRDEIVQTWKSSTNLFGMTTYRSDPVKTAVTMSQVHAKLHEAGTGYLEQLADVDGDDKADLVQNWAQGNFLGMLVWSAIDVDKIERFFHELDRRPDDKFALIQTHAPRVHMAIDEKWRPSSADYFLENTDRLCCDEGRHYLSPKNWTNDILDQNNFPFFRGHQGQLNGNVPIYAIWSRKGTIVDVGFWMFYPFNEASLTKIEGLIHDHVGDWESSTIRFKLDIDSTPMSLKPLQVGFAAHTDTPTWRSFVNFAKVDGTHPIVYEALGSHGTYPSVDLWWYDPPLPPDETSAGEAWDTWFNVVAFDVLRQQALPSQMHWPRWIIQEGKPKFWLDVDNDNGGIASRDLPVRRWGPRDNGAPGPAGPLEKAIMSNAKSLPYDTDRDGQDNNIDDDDDNDGVPDRCDVFPQISISGYIDTDSDGDPNDCDSFCVSTGMAADIDDDNDDVLDINDAYPTISITRFTNSTGNVFNCDFPYTTLTDLIDTDGDGRPNDCNSACLATGMIADADDDGDGVLDNLVPFIFTEQFDVALSTIVFSNTVMLEGIESVEGASITVSNGEYSINGGGYTSSAGTIFNTDTVSVRHFSSPSYSTVTGTVLTIGGLSDTFFTTTLTFADGFE